MVTVAWSFGGGFDAFSRTGVTHIQCPPSKLIDRILSLVSKQTYFTPLTTAGRQRIAAQSEPVKVKCQRLVRPGDIKPVCKLRNSRVDRAFDEVPDEPSLIVGPIEQVSIGRHQCVQRLQQGRHQLLGRKPRLHSARTPAIALSC
jgi:hypothetical protein